jgi:hypothetical protein
MVALRCVSVNGGKALHEAQSQIDSSYVRLVLRNRS